MSWLARSLANSLRLDPDDDVVSASPSGDPPSSFSSTANHHRQDDESDTQSDEAQSRGVKEDLSELGETLTRQFWGVASFLAPPPPPEYADSPPPDRSGSETSDSDAGVQGDFAGITGRFRSGVSEISRMTSNLITVGEEEEEEDEDDRDEVIWDGNGESGEYFNDEYDDVYSDDGDAPAVVGITHEVLAFARNIAMHPETWLDFPLDEEDDPDDFDMSEAQRDHAFAIEQFSPRLAALRFELCPCHMSLGYFWKVYFVLLHSRLNKCDAEILSTPQVMEARARWMKELHEQTKPDPDYSARSISNFRDDSNSLEEDDDYPSENMPLWSFPCEPTMSCANTDHETEKHTVASTEIPLVDKSVIEEEQVSKAKDMYSAVGSSSKILVPDVEDEDDRWLEDEDQGYGTAITMGNEDDISFSDLEDDSDLYLPKKSNAISKDQGASLKKS